MTDAIAIVSVKKNVVAAVGAHVVRKAARGQEVRMVVLDHVVTKANAVQEAREAREANAGNAGNVAVTEKTGTMGETVTFATLPGNYYVFAAIDTAKTNAIADQMKTNATVIATADATTKS